MKEKTMSENVVMDDSLLGSINKVSLKMYSNLKSLVGLYNTSRNEIIEDVYNMFVRDKYFNTIFEYYRLCDALGRLTVVRHGESNTTDEITIAPGGMDDIKHYLISDVSNNIGDFEYRNDVTTEGKTVRYTSTKKFKLNVDGISEFVSYDNVDKIEKDLFVNCSYVNTDEPQQECVFIVHSHKNFSEFDTSARSLIYNKYPVFTNFIAQLSQFTRDNVREDVTDIRMTRTVLRYKYIDPKKSQINDKEGINRPNAALNYRGDIIDYILEDISNAVNARIDGDGIGIKLSSERSPRYTPDGSYNESNKPFRLNVSIQSTIVDDGNDSPFDVFSATFAKDTNKSYRF